MNSSLIKCRGAATVPIDPAYGRMIRHPKPTLINVYITDVDKVYIDYNFHKIIEGDHVNIKFNFNKTWLPRPERRVSFIKDNMVETYALDHTNELMVPRHFLEKGKLFLNIRGFFQGVSLGSYIYKDDFYVGEGESNEVCYSNNVDIILSENYEAGFKKVIISEDDSGDLLIDKDVEKISMHNVKPFSPDNHEGYFEVNTYNSPIEIGSWYDR